MDGNTVVKHNFIPPFTAFSLKFHPKQCNNSCCMRVEVHEVGKCDPSILITKIKVYYLREVLSVVAKLTIPHWQWSDCGDHLGILVSIVSSFVRLILLRSFIRFLPLLFLVSSFVFSFFLILLFVCSFFRLFDCWFVHPFARLFVIGSVFCSFQKPSRSLVR